MSLLNPSDPVTILIVDDTPDNLRLLTKILETQGYLVRKALGGKMALQGIQRDPPNLILLDITMPDMNGYEVCQQLKASPVTATIPVIFISACDRINDKIHAFEIGGQDYITKPFQELEVLMRVKHQLLIQQQYLLLMQQNQRLEQEIAERLKAEAVIRQLSLTDELTGLYNRRGFFLLAEQQLKMGQRTQTSCCLLFADIDGLKLINDTLGHKIGDQLIVASAQLLQQTFREADIVARLGGDEFVVLFPTCSDSANHVTNDFGARLQTNITQFNQACSRPYQLSMSLGVQCGASTESASLDYMLATADKLMYDHKHLKHLAS